MAQFTILDDTEGQEIMFYARQVCCNCPVTTYDLIRFNLEQCEGVDNEVIEIANPTVRLCFICFTASHSCDSAVGADFRQDVGSFFTKAQLVNLVPDPVTGLIVEEITEIGYIYINIVDSFSDIPVN